MKSFSMMFVLLGSLIVNLSWAQGNPSDQSVAQKRVINLDVNQVQGPFNTMFKTCVGAGRANEGLRADWQQQLALVKKECDFKYIRMHGLLTDDMGVYKVDRDGHPQYNFQYIDVLYDYLHRIGMKPFVELGFMPSALASGKQTIFWWKGNVTPPKDYDEWADLVRHLVMHFTQRYGADEVKTWYFEVWNEPNLKGFWAGTQQDYFKLYRYTAEAIKSVNQAYRVGGPATAGAAWVPEMIDFCSKNKLPLDFISTHTYGVKQGYLDENGSRGTVLDSNPQSISGDVLRSHQQISNSSMPNLELHYTEWSSSYTPADPIHDSYQQAAYILQKLKQVGNAANSMSYWTFTDIFEEAGPRFTPFHGGFGLLNYEGIKKPAFYAYAYLNQLGDTELIDTDNASWACKDAQGGVQVLFWDYTYTHEKGVNNQQYYIRDLPAKSKGKVEVTIKGVPAGEYLLKIYQIGYRVNDPYATDLAMNRPKQLTRQQVQAIKKINDGSPVTQELVTVSPQQAFSRTLDLRGNDIFLLKLTALQ